jgi:plasmid stabilization system protein ParE
MEVTLSADVQAKLARIAHEGNGRPGVGSRSDRTAGTRELVLTSLPSIVVYTVRVDVIFIVRILRGAQQWP